MRIPHCVCIYLGIASLLGCSGPAKIPTEKPKIKKGKDMQGKVVDDAVGVAEDVKTAHNIGTMLD